MPTPRRKRDIKPDRRRALELLVAAAFVIAMAVAARADEVPKQFRGRWCVTEPTEATKTRDVYMRDRRGKCPITSKAGFLVAADGTRDFAIKCVLLRASYLSQYQQNIIKLACIGPGGKSWFANRTIWIDGQGRLNLGDADKGIGP